MTPQRLRNKLHKIREQGEAAAEEGGELNIIPYLDIVVNIIMFMLATTTFAAALADINVSSPTISNAVALANEEPREQPKDNLNLTVSISDKGFTIAASGAVLYQGFSFDAQGSLVQPGNTSLPTIPKIENELDYALLAKKMVEIKKSPAAEGETKVILNANPAIVYETVVRTMDACRGKLTEKANIDRVIETYEGFPDVLLSAGVN